MSVCRKDALHNVMKQCVRRKIKCHSEEILFCFSNVVYFFVHYLLPNLVLLTPLVDELEGLVICYKATSKLFSFFFLLAKAHFLCVYILHYFIIATSSHAFCLFFLKS